MAWSILRTLCLLAAVIQSRALAGSFEVKERLDALPTGWIEDGPAPATLSVTLRLALRDEEKRSTFENQLLAVSSPDHPEYGKHLRLEETNSILQPESHIIDQVYSWLADEGVSRANIADYGHWISAQMTVEEAERLLHTNFSLYRRESDGLQRARTLEYSVPAHLHSHIGTIQPTTRFDSMKANAASQLYYNDISAAAPALAARETETNCSETMDVSCLRKLYGIDNFTAPAGPQVRIGVSGFAGYHADFADLEQFLNSYARYARGSNFSVVSINNGTNPQNDSNSGFEAAMDIQYTVALAFNSTVTFYTTGGVGPLIPDLQQPNTDHIVQEPWLEHLEFLLALPDAALPHVLSISYAEDEQSLPEAYTRTVCDRFAELGARGVSVLVSSGDGGPGDGCMTNDGRNTTRFMPQFPSSCPWVTTVGGTYGYPEEEAVVLSGGGFSERFARPRWQDEAVKRWLKDAPEELKQYYNAEGRGVPDVAAQAWVDHPVIFHGSEVMDGGTRYVPSPHDSPPQPSQHHTDFSLPSQRRNAHLRGNHRAPQLPAPVTWREAAGLPESLAVLARRRGLDRHHTGQLARLLQ